MDVKTAIKSLATKAATVAVVGTAGVVGVIEGTAPVVPEDMVVQGEIVSERTLYSKTVAGPIEYAADESGKVRRRQRYEVTYSATPMHWRDEGGELKSVDTRIRRRGLVTRLVSDYDYTVSTGYYEARFKDESARDYEFERGGRSVEYVYTADTTDVEFRTETLGSSVKQDVILKTARAEKRLTWRLNTDARYTLEDGRIVFTSDDGAYLFEMSPPVGWDAACRAVDIAVSVVADTLVYAVDYDGDDYPVTIDPTTIFMPVSNNHGWAYGYDTSSWSQARSYADGRNYNASVWAFAMNDGIQYMNYRGFVSFDTSPIPDEATIDSAYVHFLYTAYADNPDSAWIVECTATDSYIGNAWYTAFPGYVSGTSAYSITPLADALESASWANDDSIDVRLNGDGLDAIDVADLTRFAVISNRDVQGTAPVVNNQEYGLAYFNNGRTYLKVFYTAFSDRITNFALSDPDTTSLFASWDNSSTDLDSLSIWTNPDGSPEWVKTVADTAMTTTISGLLPATEYIFVAKDDSGGTALYSNADTLATLAVPPSNLQLAEVYSPYVSIDFDGGSNPIGTEYALRDSTRQVWITAAGDTSSSSTWRTEADWEATYIEMTAQTRYLIGVVARNPDGVLSGYDWAEVLSGDLRMLLLAPARTGYDWTWYADDSSYSGARGAQSLGEVTNGADQLGQRYSGGTYYNYRIGAQWAIPDIDSLVTASLEMSFSGDSSDTDFSLILTPGTWADEDNGTEFYLFEGHQAGSSPYTGTNYILNWYTSSYAAKDTVGVNAQGEAAIMAAINDTLRVTALSSRDMTAVSPAGNEFVEVNDLKLILTYYDYDYVPTDVTMTMLSATSMEVSWDSRSSSQAGFLVCAAADSSALGSLTAPGAEADTLTVVPNTLYQVIVKVVGGKIDGEFSEASEAAYTWPAAFAVPFGTTEIGSSTITLLPDTTGAGNPGYTEFGVLAIDSAGDSFYVAAASRELVAGGLYGDNDAGFATLAGWGDSIRVTGIPGGHYHMWYPYVRQSETAP